jgi:hypothetical protein
MCSAQRGACIFRLLITAYADILVP